jgi:NADPH2:quinone reductase
VLGFTSGEIGSVRTNRLLLTNTSVMGVATRELWELEPDYPAEQWRDLMSLVGAGSLVPLIGAELPLAGAAAAMRLLDERRASGKVLLRIR